MNQRRIYTVLLVFGLGRLHASLDHGLTQKSRLLKFSIRQSRCTCCENLLSSKLFSPFEQRIHAVSPFQGNEPSMA